MTGYLERLAEAICDAHAVPGVYRATTQKAREHWWPVARAAFEACRLSNQKEAVQTIIPSLSTDDFPASPVPDQLETLARKVLRAAEDAAVKS